LPVFEAFPPKLLKDGAMRISIALICVAALPIVGCGPQEQARSPEFYQQPENAAEFAKALETCRTSGMGNKEKCSPVWQAKFAKDRAEERALVEQARAGRGNSDQLEGGLSVVPQAPKAAPAPAPAAARRAPAGETAEAAGAGTTS
jgi:hypothetical protein